MSERVWDNSTVDCFLKCRKLYYWRMVRNLEPKTTASSLDFGKAIHEAMDTYYTDGLDKAIEKFRETYRDREGEELRTVANGVKALEWYGKVYQHEPFKVLGKPEVGFVFPIGDLLWGGRMDLPVDWDGQLWVMEHKTTGYLNANYFKQFALDRQVTSYCVAAESYLGRKCAGCIINAIEVWKDLKRPTEKSKKPEDHFVRDPILRSTALKERFKLNVNRIVRDILWCEKENEFYEADRKDTCFSYNYDCPYRRLCEFGESPELIEREFVERKWEPFKGVSDAAIE